MNMSMNIKETFIKLTSKTYPYGSEVLLEDQLPKDIEKDIYGNYFIEIGSGSRSIFTSHLDTVCSKVEDVKHKFSDDGRFISTKSDTTLGADCKAGTTTMLYMIENKVPGLYYFFIGEEVGCIGSGMAKADDKLTHTNYDRIISFDRRGTNSIITHQSWTRCCSDKFTEKLSNEFSNYGLDLTGDDTGVCTDSLEFIEQIPECTNLSVGYYNEHTFNEKQDIHYLEHFAEACILIDWENLPTERDHNKKEYKETKRYNYNNREYTNPMDDYEDTWPSATNPEYDDAWDSDTWDTGTTWSPWVGGNEKETDPLYNINLNRFNIIKSDYNKGVLSEDYITEVIESYLESENIYDFDFATELMDLSNYYNEIDSMK